MTTIGELAKAIAEVEGFEVKLSRRTPGSRSAIEEYPYSRAARSGWTLARWRQSRFDERYPDLIVEVLDGDGNVAHGRSLLINLRSGYEWAVDEDDVKDDDEVEEAVDGPAEGRSDAVTVAAALAVPTAQPVRLQGSLTQQELESRLWAAANSLRGPVDPSDFKAYIFPLLFFRRISDTWDEEHAAAVADFGDDLTDEVEVDYHRFQLPAGCHWRDLRRVHENVGVALQNMLDHIQEANPDTLGGIFGDVPWGNKDKLPEPSLLNLIEAFDTLDLSPTRVGHDVLGAAYEYLLKQFADASGKKAGEFFTPRTVVRLLTRILNPKPGETVYDPGCGSGGMLIEAANEMLEAGGSVSQMRFYGQEINLTTAAIARMNLYLHDIEDARIIRGDTLRDPKFLDDRGNLRRFDVVITNPPFSQKNWGGEKWAADPWGRALYGVPPAGNADLAWVQHMLASMNPDGGRVGVVMPHGVLFRGGAEAQIRQGLLTADLLDAVVGLPANLFYSTGIPACLLIFRAAKPAERRQHVLFVDGSKRFAKGRNQNQLTVEDVNAVVAAYESGDDPDGTEQGVAVRLVDHSEIKENGWDLNIGRYLKGAAAEVIDVQTALAQLAAAQQALGDAVHVLGDRLKAAGYA
jgi:type I restriction enzyme M protein